MEIDHLNAAPVKLEPSLQIQFLSRCPQCGHKHPLAYMPPLRSSMCPECGIDRSDVSPPVTVESVITDGVVRFGNAMLKIGAWLSRFANRK